MKEKAQIKKIPILACKELSAHAKIKTLVVLGVGAQIAWFGGCLEIYLIIGTMQI